jgi:hypothetical protein
VLVGGCGVGGGGYLAILVTKFRSLRSSEMGIRTYRRRRRRRNPQGRISALPKLHTLA